MRKRDPRQSKGWILTIVLACIPLGCDDSPSPTSPPSDVESLPAAPVACFTVSPDPQEIDAGEMMSLEADCSQNVTSTTSFSWQLGDGRAETGPSIDVVYQEAGNYVVELTVAHDGMTSTARQSVHVRPQLDACFVFQQVHGGGALCTVDFDARCSSGEIEEFRWFFEGGRAPPDSLPDVNVTTTDPEIRYSWAEDLECFAFRPFERTVRLTIVDADGRTDSHEEVVMFGTPFIRR